MMWDDGGGWRMHDQGGAGWAMVLLMLVVAIAVVVAVFAIMRGTTTLSTAHPSPGVRVPDPRAILQERLARGEIDEQDFRARMRALDDSTG